MSGPGDSRRRVVRALAIFSFLAILWTAIVATTGPSRFQIGPIAISSRSALRPAIAATLLYVVSLLLAGAGSRSAPWQWLRDRLERWWLVTALASAAVILWVGLTYGAYAVGGTDSFGYVTQAYLWERGDLHVSLDPLASRVPWPYPDESLTPLGYRPGGTRHTMVPSYPPGLPLIMAAFLKLLGACGPYVVAPVFGAVLVLLTYVLAVRVSADRLIAAIAAVCMAACPAFLYNLVIPMSDIVTAALWTGVFVILTWPTAAASLAAGGVAGVAVLVRPNLAPLAIAGVLAATLWRARERQSRSIIRALSFVLPIGAACVFVGILNARLNGSPLSSGYGSASALYAVANFSTNAYRYAKWLIDSEGPIVLAALLPIIVPPMRPGWFTVRTMLPLGVAVVIVWLSYVCYVVFNDWWYLRFFLPVMPILFLCLAVPLAWIARRLAAPISLPAFAVIMVVLVSRWTGFALERQVLDIGIAEQRTVAAADYVARELPANAILIARHHAGSIRLYSGRPSVRFDYFAPPRLASAIAWLRDQGYRPYILLEEWEEAAFRRRFAGQGPIGELTIPVIAQMKYPMIIRVYDPLGEPGAPSYPDAIGSGSRCAPVMWPK